MNVLRTSNRMVVECPVRLTILKYFSKVANRYICQQFQSNQTSVNIRSISSSALNEKKSNSFITRGFFDCFQVIWLWNAKRTISKKRQLLKIHIMALFVFEVLNWLHYLSKYKTKIDSSVNCRPLVSIFVHTSKCICIVCDSHLISSEHSLYSLNICVLKWDALHILSGKLQMRILVYWNRFLLIFIPLSYKHVMSYRIWAQVYFTKN